MPDEIENEVENEIDTDDFVATSDLVGNAMDEKPYEFKKNFNDILLSKIRDAVDERKVEIAAAAMNPDVPEDAEEVPEDDYEEADDDVELDAVDDEGEEVEEPEEDTDA